MTPPYLLNSDIEFTVSGFCFINMFLFSDRGLEAQIIQVSFAFSRFFRSKTI